MTCDILTAGHIMFLEEIRKKYKHPIICVGLLTDKALKGYKDTIMSYKDRKYIVENLKPVDKVIPQDTLNPYDNLIKTGCMAIASGDGWEDEELKGIKKWEDYHYKEKLRIEKEAGKEMEERLWKPHILNIKLKDETHKKYSSTKIKELCKGF